MNIYFKESHGRCLGTYPLKGQQLFEVIKNAYNVGYRFFDTAQMYENEEAVGNAIYNSNIARDKFFITTKIYTLVIKNDKIDSNNNKKNTPINIGLRT